MKTQEFHFMLDKDFILNHFNCRMKDIKNILSIALVMVGKIDVNENTGIPCFYDNKAKYNEFFAPMTLSFLRDLFIRIDESKKNCEFSEIESRFFYDFYQIIEEIWRTDSYIDSDHPKDFYDSYIFNCVSPMFMCIDGKFIKFLGDVM